MKLSHGFKRTRPKRGREIAPHKFIAQFGFGSMTAFIRKHQMANQIVIHFTSPSRGSSDTALMVNRQGLYYPAIFVY